MGKPGRSNETSRDRGLTAGEVAHISAALEALLWELGLPQGRLAQALGLHRTELSPSHLAARGPLLAWALRRAALPAAAIRLRLDPDGYRALERFSATVAEVVSGFELTPEGWRGSRRELLDWGEIGVALFEAHAWEQAWPYLTPAWEGLSTPPPSPGDPALFSFLRVGTQLALWLGYQGEHREALRVLRPALKAVEGYRRANRAVLSAVACLYRTAAVAARHHPLTHPESAIRYGTAAYVMLCEQGLCPLNEVAVLRDQAKPYLAWGFGWGAAPPVPDRIEAGLAVLEQAESRADSASADERMALEAVRTRLTRIQCLALVGRSIEARRLWEALPGRDRILGSGAEGSDPTLSGQYRFTELGLTLATGAFDQTAALARDFQADPAQQLAGDRLSRAQEMERAALASDLPRLRQALLR